MAVCWLRGSGAVVGGRFLLFFVQFGFDEFKTPFNYLYSRSVHFFCALLQQISCFLADAKIDSRVFGVFTRRPSYAWGDEITSLFEHSIITVTLSTLNVNRKSITILFCRINSVFCMWTCVFTVQAAVSLLDESGCFWGKAVVQKILVDSCCVL